ncbi:MAG: shikimate dehydrogenase [Chloroflexi bacterium]|nr:MAG: shikimate dehydrogenase [Chloroflexota bacterium]
MQRAAFTAAGLRGWDYRIHDVAPEGLGGAVALLREAEYAGANVTIPHKVRVMEHVDGVDGEASAVGAVNTICRQEGRLVGMNTDVVGLRAALAEVGVDPVGAPALVLGAGGSARAAAVALAGARVTYVARRPEAAGPLKPVLAWDDPAWHRLAASADVLVNATPLGRQGEAALPPGVEPGGAVIDLVYVRGGTPLTALAASLGRPCADGWSILVAQGAAAFTAWTGRPAPIAAMTAALDR